MNNNNNDNIDAYMKSIGGTPVSPTQEPGQQNIEEQKPQNLQTEESPEGKDDISAFMSSIGGTPVEEKQQTAQEYLKSIGAKKVTEAEARQKRQYKQIYENVRDYMKSQGKEIPGEQEVPEYLQEFGAEPVRKKEEDIIPGWIKKPLGQLMTRGMGIATGGDIVQFADMAYNWIQGEGKGGLLGKGLSWLAEKYHPATTEGIREAINLQTGGELEPESIGEKIALNALDFMAMGGVLGALKKGRILKEIGGAFGASALPETTDDPTTKAYLTFVGDILGRGASSPTAMKEFAANIASIPQKVRNLPTKAIDAAKRLGIVPEASMTSGSRFIKRLERDGAEGALKSVSDDMIGKMEDISATRFSESAQLGEEVAQEAGKGLEAGLTEREGAYENLGTRFNDEPIQTPTSNRVYESYQKSSAVTPETKKVLEETVGKVYEAGEVIPKVAEEMHPEKLNKQKLGQRVQTDLNKQATTTYEKASNKYKELESRTKNTKVGVEAIDDITNSLDEIAAKGGVVHLPSSSETVFDRAAISSNNLKQVKAQAIAEAENKAGIPGLKRKLTASENKIETLKQKIETIEDQATKTRLKKQLNVAEANKRALEREIANKTKNLKVEIPVSMLINYEQNLNSILHGAGEHSQKKLLFGAKDQISKNISKGLSKSDAALYQEAKQGVREYYETFHEPDAINKMRFTQKPEEIATLVKNPSYFEQLTKQVGEKEANALRRHIIEEVGSAKNAVSKFEEYRGVFGKEYDKVLDAMKRAEGKEAATVGNLANAVEKIDERLSKTIGQKERATLEKMRASIVQDMKAAHPESAGFISDQFKKLSPEAKMQRDVARAFAEGDPNKILSNLKTKEDLVLLKKAVGNTPKGKELYEAAKRMKLGEMIDKHIIKDGVFQFDKAENVIQNWLKDPFAREIIGKENIKLMEDVLTYSKEMARAAETFKNAMPILSKYKHATGLVGFMSGVMALAAGKFTLGASVLGLPLAKKLLTKLVTDPVFKKQLLKNYQTTIPQLAGKAMTLDRAYKIARPLTEWGLVEADKYEE